jgi:hypothetical protein
MAYRITRNIEASFIEAIQTLVNADWTGVTVEKSFARVYDIKVPVICVRAGIATHDKVEIGGTATRREPQIFIDIFASDDGNKLDMKDYLIEKLKAGVTYKTYVITNGAVASRTTAGKLNVLKIDEKPIEFDTDRDKLDIHDRFRYLLILTVSTGKVEA